MGLNCTLHTFALASIAAAAFCRDPQAMQHQNWHRFKLLTCALINMRPQELDKQLLHAGHMAMTPLPLQLPCLVPYRIERQDGGTWSLMDHRRTVPSSEPDRKRCGSVAEKSTDQMRLVCSANAATCNGHSGLVFAKQMPHSSTISFDG